MHYVILRDDDTNALTPIECLEQMYRPFLERGLPVNLATIPNVRTDTLSTEGEIEGFLFARNGNTPLSVPLASNSKLVNYLRHNRGFHLLQHGYDHSLFEFDSRSPADISRRLEEGAEKFSEASPAVGSNRVGCLSPGGRATPSKRRSGDLIGRSERPFCSRIPGACFRTDALTIQCSTQ